MLDEILREVLDLTLSVLLNHDSLLLYQILLNLKLFNLSFRPETLLLETLHQSSHAVHLTNNGFFLLGQIEEFLLVEA